LHAVDKLVNLRKRGDAQQFRVHVARLSAQEDQIVALQSSVDGKDADAHALRRQVAALEQRNAEQMVQLMTLKTEMHTNNVEMSTDRVRQVQRKDEEIAALNAMLGEAETAGAQHRQECDALRRQLAVASEERDRVGAALRGAEADFEKRQVALLDELATLRARATHAEDYRETANRQLADAEDASSQQHHDNLRLKSSVAKLELRVTEQNQDIERLRAQVQDADTHLKTSMTRDKKQRESSDADRAQLKALREEIVALGTASQDASAERQLQDARKQIGSLQVRMRGVGENSHQK
jgi:chromosome segregation ATPase